MRAVADYETERAQLDSHARTRDAQARWAQTSFSQRLQIIRRLRHMLARGADSIATAAAAVSDRPIAEKLVSEVLPLTDACRWLEKNAARILASRRSGSGRPLWLRGSSFTVARMPFGLVLVIGPGNYPLFLPAAQALHALVAGNAVLLKPAPGTREVALLFAKLAAGAGLDRELLRILPEDVAAAHHAIDEGVDKVIFTGSSENGRDLLARLGDSNTPSIMELSGQDPVLVFADADLDLVVRALRFGTSLNGGETCIAPHRLVVVKSVADQLQKRLTTANIPPLLLERAVDENDVVQRANASAAGLGASIFSRDVGRARDCAARIKTGFVLINDLIVPTADPRMPFGGVKASGFGTTRGEQGLLEMTFPHVVAVRRGRFYSHFDQPSAGDAQLFVSYIRAVHGEGFARLGAARDVIRRLLRKAGSRKKGS